MTSFAKISLPVPEIHSHVAGTLTNQPTLFPPPPPSPSHSLPVFFFFFFKFCWFFCGCFGLVSFPNVLKSRQSTCMDLNNNKSRFCFNFLGCLTSHQHAECASGADLPRRMFVLPDKVADQTYLIQSQYTDIGPVNHSTDPTIPGVWQWNLWNDRCESWGKAMPPEICGGGRGTTGPGRWVFSCSAYVINSSCCHRPFSAQWN